jgi:hypothetical protein
LLHKLLEIVRIFFWCVYGFVKKCEWF